MGCGCASLGSPYLGKGDLLLPGVGEDRFDKDDTALLWAVRQDLFSIGYTSLGPSTIITRKPPMDEELRAAIVDFRSRRRLAAFVIVDLELALALKDAISNSRAFPKPQSAVAALLVKRQAEAERKAGNKSMGAGAIAVAAVAAFFLMR